ncbi:3-oxoacid CoA-transferase, partial [Vibrio fluvialis]|nr:3-oxoacid CoA-transferase [Vibrio fluvialis]
DHMQTFATQMNPAFVGRPGGEAVKPQAVDETLDAKTIIARRAAMELRSGAILNLGIGAPEYVAAVAREAGILDQFTLTVEPGAVGGEPAAGLDFGASRYPQAIISQDQMFDFYDGGGIDQAFLGLAQCDRLGDINVSRFGSRIAGCGGFINITQNAKAVFFCGTFTAQGLQTEVVNGELRIVAEGQQVKFLPAVEQITFSAAQARKMNKPVLYITERAVFTLTERGLTLTEIAPGMDLKRDVLAQMGFEPFISPGLKLMDEQIFKPQFTLRIDHE